MRPTGRADQCPQLGGNRTQRGRRLWAVHDPNSVIAVMSAARPLFRRKPKSIRDLATLQKVPTADLDAVLPRIETSSVALPESRSGTCRSPSLAQRRCRRQASHSGLQIRGLPVFTSRLRVRSRARESSGPGDWNAMKLPLRQDKSRKGGWECDLKPFVAIQRVQLPPGKGEPASRKRALQGWWQHHS